MAADGENRPVQPLVLGRKRSGTTWLASILDSHPQVAAVSATEHHGIHESHVYSYTRYCLPDYVSCAEFFEQYQKEDYHRIVDMDTGTFCGEHTGKHRVIELFRMMMDDFAERRGCGYWLEKTPKHTIYYREIVHDFSDTIFVAIRRNFLDTITSNLALYPRGRALRLRQHDRESVRGMPRSERLAARSGAGAA